MTEPKKLLSFSQVLQDQERKEKAELGQAQQTQVQPTPVQQTQVRQTRATDPSPPRSISPEVKGFTSFPNHLLDQILGTLDVYDQAILLRIYRLSRGFGKDRCEVGISRLAEATNISEKQVKRCVARLIGAGYISKAATAEGYANIYICHIMGTGKEGQVQQTRVGETQVSQAHIKEKALKENSKREEAAPDYKNCPDCQGSGFWYPEGIEKGVARCKHERVGK